MTYILKGCGFDVGVDFARAKEDTAIELAPGEYAKPGYVIGYIAGDEELRLGFMRGARVRVHIQRRYLVEC